MDVVLKMNLGFGRTTSVEPHEPVVHVVGDARCGHAELQVRGFLNLTKLLQSIAAAVQQEIRYIAKHGRSRIPVFSIDHLIGL